MTDSFSDVAISDITIPEDFTASTVSEKHISKISEAFGTEHEALFFIIAVQKGKNRYSLVDRYDVYLAAKSSGVKSVRAAILSDSDDLTAHIALSQKYFANPVTILRLIRPFAEKTGIDDALRQFYLDASFGKMYNVNLDWETLDVLEDVVNVACLAGARSVIPIQFFEVLHTFDDRKVQIDILDRIRMIIGVQKTNFRWPHREHVKKLVSAEGSKPTPSRKEKPVEISHREFNCAKCHTPYVVTPDHIEPRREKDGAVILSDDESNPVYKVPEKYQKHLGISKTSMPTVISSKDADWDSLRDRLDGKNFVVIIGKDAVNRKRM